MGRGGSDYTASIIASCVKADEIWMMGDADGMMTADPSMVDNAKMIPEVSYSEAMEMSMFGAQQIHPKTFEPLLVKKIPMRVRNELNSFVRERSGHATYSPLQTIVIKILPIDQ